MQTKAQADGEFIMGINTLATSNWHWISGSADPSPYAGHINDFYLNSTTNEVFQKTGYETWTLVGVWSPTIPGPGGNISINFTASNWQGNTITVIPSGTPGAGQIGPHDIAPGSVLYSKVQIKAGALYQEAFIETDYDIVTNTIVITKSSAYPAFDGAILVSYGN